VYQLGETSLTALKGIDLEIDQGEFVAIWGPSGSGKSTLCNILGAIDHPTSGSITIGNQDIAGLSDSQQSTLRNRSIGFIFQHFNLIKVLSALENVMMPLTIRGEKAARSRAVAMQLLKKMGLAEAANRLPDKLSGGQQQRVAIARALVTNPSLVIADEPTANLDSENAGAIVALMDRFSRTEGTTFVFSTHDQRLLDRVNRRIHLQDGQIIDDRQAPGLDHRKL
jgi:putative ABC transport system ATP-binding protein